jgi:hypothetical protein
MSEMTGAWPDETDAAILRQLKDLHTTIDAPPADLTDRVLFAIAMAGLNAEVARLQADQLVGSGARGTERTRTVSFDADSLTIMVTVVETPDGRIRVDGWLAPAEALRVEMRVRAERPGASDTSYVVLADDTGRFVFPAVDHGMAQFIVHRDVAERAGLTSTVVTPSMTV